MRRPTARSSRTQHLRPLRNQCELLLRDSRRGAGGDCSNCDHFVGGPPWKTAYGLPGGPRRSRDRQVHLASLAADVVASLGNLVCQQSAIAVNVIPLAPCRRNQTTASALFHMIDPIEDVLAPTVIERALSVFGSFKDRARVDLVQARKALTPHAFDLILGLGRQTKSSWWYRHGSILNHSKPGLMNHENSQSS